MKKTIKTLEECISDLKKLIPSHKNTRFVNFMGIDLEVEYEDTYNNRFPEDGQHIYINNVYIAGINVTVLFQENWKQTELIDIYLKEQGQ